MGKVGALKRCVEMRHLRRRRNRGETLCFIALCMFCLRDVVSATLGDDFLDEKEGQLAQVADAVQRNDVQKCELLKTCTATTCSRNTCFPQEGDVKNFTCMAVSFNKYCNASAGGPCHDKYFDYTKGFVRTAVNTDFNRVLTTIGTCAQRALDPVYKNISTPASLLRIYYGAIDGSWRAFPGSDQDVNDPECGIIKYDPRLRPWYRASTSVRKVVAILIDAAQSMSLILSPGTGQGTILENVRNFVGEFLKTLSAEDYVNIIMFDSAKATPLSPSMVPVKLNITSYLPDVGPLWQSLNDYKIEVQPGTSNVTKGIDAALSNFATNYPDAAKIILVLTDGKFATASNVSIPVATLASSNVKVFVYKIPQKDDDKLFLGSTPFANQLCSIGGSFEVIASGLSNPLLALNSFFTFTAALHAAVTKNSADYSEIYAGYEQIEGNITTVSRPVFGADNTLLGVVGMDIFINSLGNLRDPVETAILQRSLNETFKSANYVLSSANCSLQTELPSPEPCGAGVVIPPNGGFCPRTDKSSTIEDLACCKSCATPVRNRGDSDGGDNPGINIAAVVAGPVVGAIILVLLVLGIMWWKKTRAGVDSTSEPIPKFKGKDTDLAAPIAAPLVKD